MARFLLRALWICTIVTAIIAATYKCNRRSRCGCSSVSTVSFTEQRIVGGELAPQRAWEWTVSLQSNDGHVCGASLISNRVAVTAAHCFDNDDRTGWSVLAGTNDLKKTRGKGIQRRKLSSIKIHPQYNSQNNDNDIAIIKFPPLATGVHWGLAPICLPSYKKDPFVVGDQTIVVGWGRIEEGGLSSDLLLQVSVPVVPIDSVGCNASRTSAPELTICAGYEEGGKDSCQGDSGGPLMSFVRDRWYLAGVVSHGEGCARPGLPGAYTRVSQYIKFIK